MHRNPAPATTTLAAALALTALALPPTALADLQTITILHVNDTHSHLDATGPRDRHLQGTLGGLEKAASVLARLRAEAPGALFVHAGDVFNEDVTFVARLGPGGTPLLSIPELRLLASLGLDAVTVGNHELAYGPAVLAQVLASAFADGGPAVLSANLDVASSGLGAAVRPNVVKQVGAARVGFFGLTVKDALSDGTSFLGATPDELVAIARAQVVELRAVHHADVVVCLSHLGLTLDAVLARSVPGIDAIIGGHDHATAATPLLVEAPDGRSVPIVRAGEFYEWIGKLTLRIEGGRASLAGYELVPVGRGVKRSLRVTAAVSDLHDAVRGLYGEDFWREPIGFAIADVAKDVRRGTPARDAPIGNLVTDALRSQTGTDVALTAAGFFTDGLWRGPIVGADAFRVVGDGIDPDGNVLGFPLYRVELSGADLLRALELSLAMGDDFRLHVSGMSYVFDSRREPGARLVSAAVQGAAIDPLRVYSATVNLGMVQGLARFPGVQLAGEPRPAGIGEYAAVRDWIARLGVVLYAPEGRIVDVALAGSGDDGRPAR